MSDCVEKENEAITKVKTAGDWMASSEIDIYNQAGLLSAGTNQAGQQ